MKIMLNNRFDHLIKNHIDQKTKPPGSLGQLEALAFQLAKIQSAKQDQFSKTIELNKPTVMVFAGDHGVAEQGVSIAPSAVTQQMVLNFLHGGAAINCFCRSNSLEFGVVDCGILEAIHDDTHQLISMRLGAGTNDFANEKAMTLAQVQTGLDNGDTLVSKLKEKGCNFLMFGEMGIGNTSSASAILSALTQLPVAESVGLGTGISDKQLELKKKVVQQGVNRCSDTDPKQVLSEVGGFEIVHMVGAFIGAAKRGIPVLVDGFIVSVAALAAYKMYPAVKDYLLFAHCSEEGAHPFVLKQFEAEPILRLGLRLGEGTGAALAYPLVKAAAEFYNSMASFESAGVTV